MMRIFLKISLCFLLLVTASPLLLQTRLAKEQVKKGLISVAKKQGIELSIEKLEGAIPLEWTLHGVEVKWKDYPRLEIQTLKLRFALFPLFKKHLELSYCKAFVASCNQTAFEASVMGRIDLDGKRSTRISHFLMEGEDFFFRMNGRINSDLSLQKGDLTFYLPNLSLFPSLDSTGSVIGKARLSKESANIECIFEELIIHSQSFSTAKIVIDAKEKNHSWQGNANCVSNNVDLPLEGAFAFHFTPRSKLISITDFRIQGPETHLFGNLDLDPTLRCMEGTVFGQCRDLRALHSLFPGSYLKGRVGAKFDFKSYSSLQDLTCQLEIEDFAAYDTQCKALTIESSLYDLFGDFKGECSILGEHMTFPEMELSHIEVQSTFEPTPSPFTFALKGTWKDPFEINGSGHWQKRKKGVFINTKDFNGFAFKKPFSLCEPFSIEWSPDHFKMSNFSFDIGKGYLASRIDLTKSSSLIKIKGQDFPLEFITLPHKHFSIEGMSTFDVDLLSWEDHIQGTCNIALKRAHFRSEGVEDTFSTKGSVQIHINGNRAQVHGDMKALDGQYAHFFGSLPIQYQHFPFQVQITPDQPLSGELLAEGKLEELFDFINIGAHRVQGWLSTHLYFSNTLANPYLQGSMELQDGLYENYYTGTYLENIDAKAKADDQTVYITELQATDRQKGEVKAEGSILLSPKEKFPYSLTAQLNNVHTVSFDTISGKFSGEVTISGDQLGATAQGDLKVENATFRIPDELPSALPQIPITFINPPEKISRKKILPPSVAPLLLDLNIDVPSKAYVEGKGLNAELKGKLHVTGTYVDILASGTLQLLTGDYILFGKVFNLTQGEIIFTDKPNPSAYLSLRASCDLPDVTVTAILRGPLSAPKLTLQSSPQLSTSSLLAQILFNKDISEISAVQALQLAQTVISLSGNSGPDILEKIRKTLGIDRLTLITSENDPGKISLQIGKYLMRGVLLTLSQGAESRNVTVEVDLKKGILFQAEVNENQQGKFSLKWHHHY